MSSRTAALVLALLASVTACRDLVQSGDPPLPERIGEGLLLAPDGTPLPGTRVIVDNDRFIRSTTGRVTWQGETDAFGRFQAEVLGKRPFDVRAFPEPETGLPDFRFLGVMFPEAGPAVLQLPMKHFTGRLSWEGEVPPLDLSRFRVIFRYEEDTWFHHLEIVPTATGRLAGWLTPAQTYVVQVRSFGTDEAVGYDWETPLELEEGEPLDLVMPAVGFDLLATMGNGPAVASRIAVRVEGQQSGASLAQSLIVGDQPVRAFGFPEVSLVIIGPVGEAPFLTKKFYLDLSQPGAALAANLGELRLTVHVADADGLPWAGARVRISQEQLDHQLLTTGLDGMAQIFLSGGSYLVEAMPRPTGTFEISTVAHVVADTEITLTFD